MRSRVLMLSLAALVIFTGGCDRAGDHPEAVEEPTTSERDLGAAIPRALGKLEVLSGPIPCGEQECYGIEVSCPGVAAPEQGWLKVGSGAEFPKGTILFTVGGPGTGLLERSGPEASRILNELRAAGFRTVQLDWRGGWLFSSPGEEAGLARLACRPATVARWVYDNLHEETPTGGFCATGNSGGAMQVSFMLTHYGLEDILSAVVPTGGPPLARLDLFCLEDESSFERPDYGALIADAGFGFPSDGSGPCSRGDASFRERLREGSVSLGGDYFYPKTLVWFLFGEEDSPRTIQQGKTYYDRLVAEGSPLVGMEILPETPHGVHRSQEGADRIRDVLLNECRPQNAPDQ